ncbi:MAG: hypothetical protein DMG75_11850 [Acidobacteria bacterium]|nr:MAG: hypothetical protein DMG75_11850 [Acidobacteriota bacterium]
MVGKPDFSSITFTLNGTAFAVGDFINALVAFLLVAVAVYFFVVPLRPSYINRNLCRMSRPIKQEKNGRRMIGHATTRTPSKLGRRDPGNDIAAACSGNSPASPPTATILARLVCRSLQVLPICGLIIVTEGTGIYQRPHFPVGKIEPYCSPLV